MSTTRNSTTVEGRSVADLLIEEVDDGFLGFVSGEYTEAVNGLLPRLVGRFLCDADKVPLNLTDVTLNLRLRDSEWRMAANVDDLKFEINTVTIYFTLAPKNFYYPSQSNKYNSITTAINEMYFADIENTELLDDRLVELNQVGVTNHRFTNILLSSVKSPSIFAYNFNGLTITDLNSRAGIKTIDPNNKSYYIEDKSKRFLLDDLLESQPSYNPSFTKDGNTDISILEWGGIKMNYKEYLSDYVKNIIDNTIEQKNLNLNIRITSQADLEINAGDLINISLPDIDVTDFVVVDKLILIGSEIKYNYGVRSLDN